MDQCWHASSPSSKVDVKAFEEQTLGAMCLAYSAHKRHNFTIMDKDGVQPVKSEVGNWVFRCSSGDSITFLRVKTYNIATALIMSLVLKRCRSL